MEFSKSELKRLHTVLVAGDFKLGPVAICLCGILVPFFMFYTIKAGGFRLNASDAAGILGLFFGMMACIAQIVSLEGLIRKLMNKIKDADPTFYKRVDQFPLQED